ncbi:Rha family transcriptional regulator [Megasphaera sp.]|uniref:Rha family transcriptional regulator n=1 Tax=Megasphaera sp. TaxID=2023260 RepID=UPI00307AD2D2
MNELVTVYKNQLVTDSRQVAEHFEKQHQHVIRDIENLVNKAEEKDASKIGRMFFETTMPDAYGRMKRVYLMNRDGFSLLVMGFTGAKALEWKLKFLEAFNAMEKAIKTPQITPNPHYRTRMIKTAVKDAADTAAMIADTFGVKKPMAMTAAMQMVGKAYGVDMTPLKQFIPAEDSPSTLTPTKIAAELGILNSKGNPSPQKVNAMLKDKGLQEKVGPDWAPTEAGKAYCERIPYTRNNGHSGYQLLWSHEILELLKSEDQEAGH